MTRWRRIALYFTLAGVFISALSFLQSFTGFPKSTAFDIFLWFIQAPIILLVWNFEISYLYIQGPLTIVYFAAIGFLLGVVAEHSRRRLLHLSVLIVGLVILHIMAGFVVASWTATFVKELGEALTLVGAQTT